MHEPKDIFYLHNIVISHKYVYFLKSCMQKSKE